MRILIVSQYFWPEEFRVNEIAEELVQRGFEVDVLTGKPNYPQGKIFAGYGIFSRNKEKHHGASIYRVPLIPRGSGGGLRLAINYLSFVFFACLLGPMLCRKRYDLIFVVQLSPVTVAVPAILLKKIMKVPMVLWVLDLWPESIRAAEGPQSNLLIYLVGSLVRWIYGHSDQLLISSKGFRNSLRSFNVPDSKIAYFPNWSKDDVQKEAEIQEPAPLPVELPDGFILMFTGNIGAAQDFETVLAAMQNLQCEREIQWVIVGDGRRYEWLKNEVNNRKLKQCVHILGRHPSVLMPNFYQHADTLLVTLKKDKIFEYTVPGKIQTYMASGKPIIAGINGEAADLINISGAGFSCNAQDANALTECVLKMYRSSKEERAEMGQHGYNYFRENFERKYLMSDLERKFREQLVA